MVDMYLEQSTDGYPRLKDIPKISRAEVKALIQGGFTTVDEIAESASEDVAFTCNLSSEKAESIIGRANRLVHDLTEEFWSDFPNRMTTWEELSDVKYQYFDEAFERVYDSETDNAPLQENNLFEKMMGEIREQRHLGVAVNNASLNKIGVLLAFSSLLFVELLIYAVQADWTEAGLNAALPLLASMISVAASFSLALWTIVSQLSKPPIGPDMHRILADMRNNSKDREKMMVMSTIASHLKTVSYNKILHSRTVTVGKFLTAGIYLVALAFAMTVG
jgi:hypothetical protein